MPTKQKGTIKTYYEIRYIFQYKNNISKEKNRRTEEQKNKTGS